MPCVIVPRRTLDEQSLVDACLDLDPPIDVGVCSDNWWMTIEVSLADGRGEVYEVEGPTPARRGLFTMALQLAKRISRAATRGENP